MNNFLMEHPFIDYSASYTDLYELTMAQVYFQQNRLNESSVFDYFFRKNPFNGGYVISAGLHDLLEVLEKISFTGHDLKYLKEIGFDEKFLEYLQKFHFTGDIFAVEEGDVIFPNSPVLVVDAHIIEAQIIETIILNLLNFQSLIATKASRIRYVAQDKTLIDFGLRRSQGPAGYYASRAAIVGGFNATSHVRAAMDFGISPSGTMAHSFVQSMSDELTAFRAYARSQKDQCVLLVDTYDTLQSGIPNAIKVGYELAKEGFQLRAVRLDSGDLAYLAKESRRMLDEAGLPYVKIAASNQLDEYVIKSLEEQGAPIDIYGVGTKLVTGFPDGALDGVYKMSEYNQIPTVKLSENIKKTTLPGRKQLFRLLNTNEEFAGADLISQFDEMQDAIKWMHHPDDPYKSMSIDSFQKTPLLRKVMSKGQKVVVSPSLSSIADYAQEQMKKLSPEYKRFENPHLYKVGISTKLRDQRNALIRKHRS